jgi:hypothetical protein
MNKARLTTITIPKADLENSESMIDQCQPTMVDAVKSQRSKILIIRDSNLLLL